MMTLEERIADVDDSSDAELRDEQYRLEVLRRDEELGHIRVLIGSLKINEKLRNSKSPHIREAFLDIEAEAMRGHAIEEQHGAGALLNLDHPFVQRLAKGGAPGGGPVIPASFVQAAQAYRAACALNGDR